jgi:hypothetical protein
MYRMAHSFAWLKLTFNTGLLAQTARMVMLAYTFRRSRRTILHPMVWKYDLQGAGRALVQYQIFENLFPFCSRSQPGRRCT